MTTATELTYASATIDDLPPLWDGLAKLVREGLGITAFDVQIVDLPPNYTTDAHDERETGQQELYVALSGHGAVIVHEEHDQALLLDPTASWRSARRRSALSRAARTACASSASARRPARPTTHPPGRRATYSSDARRDVGLLNRDIRG